MASDCAHPSILLAMFRAQLDVARCQDRYWHLQDLLKKGHSRSQFDAANPSVRAKIAAMRRPLPWNLCAAR